MANFCGFCGASGEGGRFCSSCGQPMVDASPTDPTLHLPVAEPAEPEPAAYDAPAPPVEPPPAAYQPPPYPHQQPAPAWPQQGPPSGQGQGQGHPGVGWSGAPSAPAPRPSTPGINPFIGVPVGDYVRDAAAVFCLFAALGMPWDFLNDGGDRWWVVISVLLSVASLALPYVGKARVVPGWTPQHVRIFKLAANVPLLASVLAALVNELVNADDVFAGGLGTGIAMALAGAVLAAQPRDADEDRSPGGDRLWTLATKVTGVAAVAVALLTFIAYFLDDLTGDSILLDDVLEFVVILLLFPVMFLVVIGWPVVSSLGGSPAWRRVLSVVSFTVVVVALLALADDGGGLFDAFRVERWNSPVGGTFLVGALAALTVSRPQQRHTAPRMEPVTAWLATASSALLVSAVALGVSVLSLLLAMVSREELAASHIVLSMMMLGSAVMAAFAMSLLSDVRRNRPRILGLLGALLLLSVISIAVTDSQDIGFPANAWVTAMWFSLPGLALYALTVPREVRHALGPLIAPAPQQAPQQQQPGASTPGYQAPPATPQYDQAPPPPPGFQRPDDQRPPAVEPPH